MRYQSTKTFGHDLGFSCCFRQHSATHSHCSLLHGYALSFKFVFEAETLDGRNWVQDFGGLKNLKLALSDMFDHTLVVAANDPNRADLVQLAHLGIAKVIIIDAVGCEAFAELAYKIACNVIYAEQCGDVLKEEVGLQRVKVVSCEVAEHGANSAIYHGE